MDQWHLFLKFFNIGFSFATLQAFGKTPPEINSLQSTKTGFAKMWPPSVKNLPKNLSTPAALELSISCMIFETVFSVVPKRQK